MPYAAKWTARMHDSFGTTTVTASDAVLPARKGDQIGAAEVDAVGTASPNPNSSSVITTDASSVMASVRECDWTFSSDYVCTIMHANQQHTGTDSTDKGSNSQTSDGVVLRARALPAHSSLPLASFTSSITTANPSETTSALPQEWSVQDIQSSGIDIEMLKNQDEPILFYDEFILYQVD